MNRLKELRKEKKYTQAQIAELMDVNVKTISRWEKGEFEIKPAQAKMLADFFGVSVGYLLGYSDKEEHSSSIELKNDIRRELIEQLLEANRRETAIDRGFSMQGLLDENSALRDENRRLTNELTDSYTVNAKANLLDIIIEEGYILQSTIDKCISKLNETDQQEIRKVL